MNNHNNCIVAQSGGPTTVINSSLAGVISAAKLSKKFENIYGAVNGIQGILSNNIIDLKDSFKDNIFLINALKLSPAMYLGSCRYRLSDDQTHEDYAKIFEFFDKNNIDYFFYIGGNDSMDTVAKLSAYAQNNNLTTKIIGIPKTIDNDLANIDHSPGFGSAAKYIATSMLEIAHDAYIYNIPSVTIVEIMGRNAGWLTAASALARNPYSQAPHLIYLPERPFSEEQFLIDVKEQLSIRKHVIIAVSEGIKDSYSNYISANSKDVDKFGHVMLNGTGKYLERLCSNELNCKVRSIELNVLQRCAGHLLSRTDVNEAFRLGEEAVEIALQGITSVMATLKRVSNVPYTVEYTYENIYDIANKEKTIPLDWISCNGNDVTSELVDYMKPLICGEIQTEYIDGLPFYLPVPHLSKIKK